MPHECPYEAASEGKLGWNAESVGGVGGRIILKCRLASCMETPLIARRREGVGEPCRAVGVSDATDPEGS